MNLSTKPSKTTATERAHPFNAPVRIEFDNQSNHALLSGIRNGEMLVETFKPLPKGSNVTVHIDDDQNRYICRVKELDFDSSILTMMLLEIVEVVRGSDA